MTDARAHWDSHANQGRTPERVERDVKLGGLLLLGFLMFLGGVVLVMSYHALERWLG